jgi:hypothetical protein
VAPRPVQPRTATIASLHILQLLDLPITEPSASDSTPVDGLSANIHGPSRRSKNGDSFTVDNHLESLTFHSDLRHPPVDLRPLSS